MKEEKLSLKYSKMKKKIICLGLESTAHTYSCGIVTSDGKILANVKDSYSSSHKGMIPHEMVAHHRAVADDVINSALKEAKITMAEVSFIAYSAGPGLDPSLWFGYHKAKELAEKYNLKIVGVNHCSSHLSIGKLWNKLNDPVYLYVSGVNTQVIVQEKKKGKQNLEEGRYHVMGETLDIGLGNMLDKFGRILGLGFPAGPQIEMLSKKGKYVELPYTVKGMDVSFSGLLTKVQQLFERKQATKEDLCFSLQETAFAMCAEVAERALAHSGKKELLLVGGVGANKHFCEMLELMCKERNAKFYRVPMDLAGDQGAMIAWEGFLRKDKYGDMEVNPHWRADEV